MLEESQKLVVRRELDAILSSPAFRSSARCKNFLSFVVQCSLDGRVELLKERLIGMEVFSRSSDYSTGEDSIVRAKATELRRRLAKYYLEVESTPEVRIEIPAGSYAPVFRWGLTGSSGNGTPLDQPLQGRRLWVRRALVLYSSTEQQEARDPGDYLRPSTNSGCPCCVARALRSFTCLLRNSSGFRGVSMRANGGTPAQPVLPNKTC
jgi:hypothetical protein